MGKKSTPVPLIAIAVIFAYGFIAARSGIAANNGDYENFPLAWGMQSQTRFKDSECPVISGKYFSESKDQEIRIQKSPIDSRNLSEITSRTLFRHPRGQEWEIRYFDTQLMEENFYIEILQPTAKKLELHQTLNDGKGVRIRIFDQTLGDFYCKAGYIHIKPYERKQSGQYAKREDRFSLTTNGAFVYEVRIENMRSEMLVFSTSSAFRIWYRFNQIE